jgi:peptide/nickel transport system permease protein
VPPILKFLLKRVAAGVVVVFLVATAVFFVTRIVTKPELTFLPIDATPAQREAVQHYLGLDKPLTDQYVSFIGKLAHGDLGQSFWQEDKDALPLVLERLPATFELTGVAMIFALLLAVPFGILASLRPGKALDRATVTVSLLGLSMPQFWLGFMLILIFGVKLHWFPTSGNQEPFSVVLPALALALPTAGKITQMMRSGMLDEMDQSYMLTADAKGLSLWYRITHHAFRNTLVPVLTQTSFEYARMIAGFTVVVETVFAWPGIGLLMIQALQQQDLVLVQAIVVVVAVLIVVLNIVTDVLYKIVDPRIELA